MQDTGQPSTGHSLLCGLAMVVQQVGQDLRSQGSHGSGRVDRQTLYEHLSPHRVSRAQEGGPGRVDTGLHSAFLHHVEGVATGEGAQSQSAESAHLQSSEAIINT